MRKFVFPRNLLHFTFGSEMLKFHIIGMCFFLDWVGGLSWFLTVSLVCKKFSIMGYNYSNRGIRKLYMVQIWNHFFSDLFMFGRIGLLVVNWDSTTINLVSWCTFQEIKQRKKFLETHVVSFGLLVLFCFDVEHSQSLCTTKSIVPKCDNSSYFRSIQTLQVQNSWQI